MVVREFPAPASLRMRRTMPGLQIAVVGCGYWGAKHARVLSQLPEVSRIVLVDRSEESRTKLAALYPRTTCSANYEDALEQVQAVVIATPPSEHFSLTTRALQAGRHALVEKPLTTGLADAQALLREASQQNLILMVGHTFEFNPAVRELRNIIDRGVLGDVLFINSARLSLGLYRRDVDVVWDLAPHDVSIMNFLLHSYPSKASGWGSSHVYPGVRDVAHFQLDYERVGAVGYGHVSWLDPRKIRQVTVVGTRKMAIYDDLCEERLRIYDRAVLGPLEAAEIGRGNNDKTPRYMCGEIVSPAIADEEPLKIEDQHFLDCIRGKADSSDNAEGGIAVVGILESIERSLQSGQAVCIEPSGGRASDTLLSA